MENVKLAVSLLALAILVAPALADVSPFGRKQINWDGYKAYTIPYDSNDCMNYNYNNGQYPQDLTILNTPTTITLQPNSYAEIRRNGTTIQINFGSQIKKSSYSVDSISFDLPKSGTSGDNCTGTFYLVFAAPAGETTTTLQTNATTTTIATNTSTTTTSTTAITLPLNATTTTIPSQTNCDFICSIKNFINGIFDWLGRIKV